jgi:ribosomal protein S19
MGTYIIYKKNKYIQLKDLNKKFLIYNGKNLQKLIISKNMIGYKFGEFVMTRKVVTFKKKKNG